MAAVKVLAVIALIKIWGHRPVLAGAHPSDAIWAPAAAGIARKSCIQTNPPGAFLSKTMDNIQITRDQLEAVRIEMMGIGARKNEILKAMEDNHQHMKSMVNTIMFPTLEGILNQRFNAIPSMHHQCPHCDRSFDTAKGSLAWVLRVLDWEPQGVAEAAAELMALIGETDASLPDSEFSGYDSDQIAFKNVDQQFVWNNNCQFNVLPKVYPSPPPSPPQGFGNSHSPSPAIIISGSML